MKQSCRLLLLALLSVSLFSPLESQLFAAKGKEPNAKSYCRASCGSGSPVSTECSGTCSATDRNCAIGQRGYVQCGSTITYCASPCPSSCGSDSYCDTNCQYDPDCCVQDGYCNPNCGFDLDCMCLSISCTSHSQCQPGGFCDFTGTCVCP